MTALMARSIEFLLLLLVLARGGGPGMARYGARHTLIFRQVAANYRVLAVASCQLPWTHSYKRVEETHE